MSLTKRTPMTLALAACLAPTTALSDSTSIIYESAVALVMLDPQTAGFDCAFNDRPAEVTITPDALATAVVKFPDALFGSATPPTVTVRRGVDRRQEPLTGTSSGFQAALVAEFPFEPIGSPEDWDLGVMGDMKFCVGPATLQYVQGDFVASARFGEYNTSLQDIDGTANSTYASYLGQSTWGPAPYEITTQQRVKDIGSDARLAGRHLGLYSFNHYISPATFVHESTLPNLEYQVKLSVRLILVDQNQN